MTVAVHRRAPTSGDLIAAHAAVCDAIIEAALEVDWASTASSGHPHLYNEDTGRSTVDLDAISRLAAASVHLHDALARVAELEETAYQVGRSQGRAEMTTRAR